MKTKKHAEKLADRRAAYGDRRVSRTLDRMAAEIMATDPAVKLADARSQALRVMVRQMS